MAQVVAVTANSGPKVRSDIEVTLEITETGGILTDIKSKVKSMYGRSIERQCLEVLEFFGIRNAKLSVVDSGALPYVISARIEATIRQLTGEKRELLPAMIPENNYKSSAQRFRFSRLYLPGISPGLFINAVLLNPDGVILVLEDSIALAKKD